MSTNIKNLSLLIPFLAYILLTSCNSDIEPAFSDSSDSNEIILQSRTISTPSPNKLPIKALEEEKTRASNPNNEIIGNSDVLLGYSYSVGNSLVGSMENVRFAVLDLEKIRNKYPSAISPLSTPTGDYHIYSYNGMGRYTEKSDVSKTVKTGFELNLGIFKIGRERKLTEIFNNVNLNDGNTVLGELDLEIIRGQFSLLCTVDKRRTYAREYLTNTFQTDLYRGSIGNLLNSYGHFVLRAYYTGGKAMALYAGSYKKSQITTEKEKALEKDINASYFWEKDSASGRMGFNGKNGSSSDNSFETENTQVYIRTFGGSPVYQVSLPARSLQSISVDLTSWAQSINDPNTNTLIGICSGGNDEECGLFPLSDFILEQNFKNRMDDTTLGVLESLDDIVEPKIEIVKVFARVDSNGTPLYEVAAVLNTRQGDKIVLSDGSFVNATDSELRAFNDNQTMMNRVQEIFAQKKQIFQGLQFTTNYTTKYDPNVRKPLCIRLNGFTEASMSLFVDPNSNMRYIIDSSKKIALAYNEDEDYGDYVLDLYGIRDWVESLPRKNTSMMVLQFYTVIGL